MDHFTFLMFAVFLASLEQFSFSEPKMCLKLWGLSYLILWKQMSDVHIVAITDLHDMIHGSTVWDIGQEKCSLSSY